jgi:hypothetical protein
LIGGRGDLRIGTRIRGERFESARGVSQGECSISDLERIDTPSIFRLMSSPAALARMLSTFDVSWSQLLPGVEHLDGTGLDSRS